MEVQILPCVEQLSRSASVRAAAAAQQLDMACHWPPHEHSTPTSLQVKQSECSQVYLQWEVPGLFQAPSCSTVIQKQQNWYQSTHQPLLLFITSRQGMVLSKNRALTPEDPPVFFKLCRCLYGPWQLGHLWSHGCVGSAGHPAAG